MQIKLGTTDAPMGLGYSFSRNLFKVQSGAYSGRMAAIVHTSSSDIVLHYSDAPYKTWLGPVGITSDNGDSAEGCFMDENDNIFVVYSAAGTGSLMLKKLAYADGLWTPGPAVVVCEGAICTRPSITEQADGKLWVSYSRLETPYQNVHVKFSIDCGETWGAGTADPGEQFSSQEMETYSLLLTGTDQVYLVYKPGTDRVCCRAIGANSDTWSDEVTVVTFTPPYTGEFDAAIAPDGRLAVVVSSERLMYREYDGANWGVLQVLHGSYSMTPQVYFRRNVPVVVFQTPWVGGKGILMYVDRVTGSFSPPAMLDRRVGHYDRVLLYNGASATYEDITDAAQNITQADLLHSTSGCLVRDVGDAVYVGMDRRFRFLECDLSTPGSGGALVYSYWDGVAWKAFTPVCGTLALDSLVNDIVLWEDYDSVPADWQLRVVNGNSLFWVKVEVTSTFAIGPIGDYITAFSKVAALSFRR